MADSDIDKKLNAIAILVDSMLNNEDENNELGFCLCVASFVNDKSFAVLRNTDNNDTEKLLKAGLKYLEEDS